jgi:hypothetical protein
MPLGAGGKSLLRSSWSVCWKVAISTTAALFLLYVALHHGDFRELSLRTLTAAVVIFGYCAFYGLWAGIAAALFAVGWRFWGGWILLPAFGALVGATVFVALSLLLLSRFDLRPGGIHGGGDFAALLILSGLALIGVVGATIGGLICTVLTAWLARRRRQTSQSMPQAPKPQVNP